MHGDLLDRHRSLRVLIGLVIAALTMYICGVVWSVLVVFGDVIRISPGMLALQAAGLVAIVTGVILVARAPCLSALRPMASVPVPRLPVRHGHRDAHEADQRRGRHLPRGIPWVEPTGCFNWQLDLLVLGAGHRGLGVAGGLGSVAGSVGG